MRSFGARDALPIDEVLPALNHTLAAGTCSVLQAPPGAGKTTRVPLALLDQPWLGGRSILVLEPRRLAARAAAMHMASLLGEAVGRTVGYRMRFDVNVSPATRVEVLTEGILTRRLHADPGLEGVGLVIFDEFHERHLHMDLALALCLDSVRTIRGDLRLLVMSATLDGEAVAEMLSGAPVITAHGRQFPVDVRYAVPDPESPLPQGVAQAILRALKPPQGDVLAFLPGAWEIRRTQHLLEAAIQHHAVDVYPLYGDLPWADQERAIRATRGARRRVILATPIAETSLTIEGVGVVVDSGFVRVPEFDPRTGLTRLTTRRISRASADQRAGRAGRLAPGVCYRMWSETTQQGLTARPTPEIRSADLAPLALELAHWGVSDAATLSWLDPPPAGALAHARGLLTELGALDEQGRITVSGRAMAAFPVHPRLAHMIAEADPRGLGGLACDLAALLSERDLFRGGREKSCDLVDRLEGLRAFRDTGRVGALRFEPDVCRRVDRAAKQFRKVLRHQRSALGPASDEAVGGLLAFAYPDRIAQQRAPGDRHYVLTSGRAACVPASEHRFRPSYLVAADLDAGETEGTIHLAAAVDLETIRREMSSRIRTTDVIRWDGRLQRVVARREVRLGELLLESGPLADPDPQQLRRAMLDAIRELGVAALPWTTEARDWQARVLSLRQWCPDEGWPDVSDAALQTGIDTWLGPHLERVTRPQQVAHVDLLAALTAQLDWRQRQRLAEGAPTHLTVPSGSRVRLAYRPGESPVLAVKLQEMFGLVDTPRVAWGRVPVTLHLLSPARRPIQVTQDLRGFWERTYAGVRKELKGRYPKHPWPDDPRSAMPTARTKGGRAK